IRAMAVDMETATIFSVGFANKIPTGALLLVSDQPMVPDGVKTAESDLAVTEKYVETHLKIGIDALKQLINKGLTVKHLKFLEECLFFGSTYRITYMSWLCFFSL